MVMSFGVTRKPGAVRHACLGGSRGFETISFHVLVSFPDVEPSLQKPFDRPFAQAPSPRSVRF